VETNRNGEDRIESSGKKTKKLEREKTALFKA
jgi:hypothetical protein